MVTTNWCAAPWVRLKVWVAAVSAPEVKVSVFVFEIKPYAPRPEKVATPDVGEAESVPVNVEPPVKATATDVA